MCRFLKKNNDNEEYPFILCGKAECKGGNEGAINRQVTSQRIRGTELVSLREMPPTRETIPPEVKANMKF